MSWERYPGRPRRPGSGFEDSWRETERLWHNYGKWALLALLFVLVAVALFTSYFTVAVNEEAIVLRFGRYSDTKGPGLHFKLPFGIDRVVKQEVNTVHKEEFGFRTTRADVKSEFNYSDTQAKAVALMLTADLNVADIRWVVRYKIKELNAYVFNVENVEQAIRDASEAVMRKIVGDSSIDEVLMSRPAEMEGLARDEIQELLDMYGCGIDVRSVKFKQLDPPRQVKDAFDEVNQARQMRDQIINEAEAQKNRELIPAEGAKKRMIERANGYREKRINEAQGDAQAFLAVLAEYEKAEEVTRRRLYLETMAKVLPQCGKITLIDESQKGVLPLLRLEDEKGGAR